MTERSLYIAKEVRDKLIRYEQVKLLISAIPTSISGTFLGIFFVLLSLWPVIEHTRLLLWAALLSMISVVRAVHAYMFWKIMPPLEDIGKWAWQFVGVSVIASIIWGTTGIWLFAEEHVIQQVMLAFILSVTCAVAIANLSALRIPSLLFVIFTLTPIAIHFLYTDTEVGHVMGSMILVLIILYVANALRVYRTTLSNITLTLDALASEEELRTSQQRLAMHVLRTPLGVIEWNTRFEVVEWNPAAEKIFGYSREEAIGRNAVGFIVPANISEQVNLVWQDLLDNTGGLHNSNENLTKDGRTILCEWYNTPLIDESGKVIGVASLTQDITERRRLEKIKNEFVSVVSHELRTPLTSIQGSLGLILGGTVKHDPEKNQELLEIANNNTQRLLLLINDILDIEKIESGLLDFNYQSIDPMSLIEQTISANSGYAVQFGVNLTISGTIDGAEVHVDPDRIMQVLNNLISNAIKFSPRGEKIELAAARRDGFIRISITDYGCGIDDAFRGKLFEKFSQQDTSNTRGVGGTGLGLSIAKGIVEHHNGIIDYLSQEGRGTTFYFELPEKSAESAS